MKGRQFRKSILFKTIIIAIAVGLLAVAVYLAQLYQLRGRWSAVFPILSPAPAAIAGEGLAPISATATGVENTSYKDCQDCHQTATNQWKVSDLHHSFTNPIFQDGFSVETKNLCVHCHAPLEKQSAQVIPYLQEYSLKKVQRIPDVASEGINCAVCHVRAEMIVTSRPGSSQHRIHKIDEAESPFGCFDCHNPFLTSPVQRIALVKERIRAEGEKKKCNACHEQSPSPDKKSEKAKVYHRTVLSTYFGDSSFCANCHEFHIPVIENGRVRISRQPMQTTYSEWQEYKQAGGKEDCVSCHMPKGKHLFPGTELEFLKKSIKVSVKVKNDASLLFTVQSVNTGHNFPTGDLFRHLTLSISLNQTKWYEIARMGRVFGPAALSESASLANTEKRLISNTSLRPFEKRTITVSAEQLLDMREDTEHHTPGKRIMFDRISYRIQYHLSSPLDEKRNGLSQGLSILELVRGSVAVQPSKR